MAGIKSTFAGATISICSTAQTPPLNQAAFEALTFIDIGSVGNFGDSGKSANIASYNTVDDSVTQKAKGVVDGGSMTVECARIYDDTGQAAMRTACDTNYNYAIKIELADAPSASYTNTIIYNCGVVTGPARPGGSRDDFVREVFTIGFNQEEVVVNPAAI